MTTTEELDQKREEFKSQGMPKEDMETMGAAARELEESDICSVSLQVGREAPNFTLPDSNGMPVTLADHLKDGPAVIVFYRGSWCPYCNIYLRGLQRIMPELREHGASLIAISPQLPDHTANSVQENDLSFPVLSDVGSKVCNYFGTVFPLPGEVLSIFKKNGLDLQAINGDSCPASLPVPSTFIVGKDSKVIWRHFEVDYTHRAEPMEILKVISNL